MNAIKSALIEDTADFVAWVRRSETRFSAKLPGL